MYAVVTTGGKQYRVEAGSELIVERLVAEPGAVITFDRVLLVGDGEAVTIGTPTVDGASVSGTVLGEQLGPKLIIFKFKQKVKYRRTTGHRQHLTRVRIDEISAGGKRARADTTESEPVAVADDADELTASAKTDAPKRAARTRKAAAAPEADAPARPATRRRAPAKKAESEE